MVLVGTVLTQFLAFSASLPLTVCTATMRFTHCNGGEYSTLMLAGKAVEAVLSRVISAKCSIQLFTDGGTPAADVYKVKDQLLAPRGVSVWEVAAGGEDANVTLAQISHEVHKARRATVQ
nr:uncharacterized protein LOC123755115 [Procambarus clarkii]